MASRQKEFQMGFFDKLLGGGHSRGHSDRHGKGQGNSHGSHGGSHGGSHHNDQQNHRDIPSIQDNSWGRSGGQMPPITASFIACIQCGVANDLTSRFCKQCGKPLQNVQCEGCNAEVRPDVKFCGQCGKSRY